MRGSSSHAGISRVSSLARGVIFVVIAVLGVLPAADRPGWLQPLNREQLLCCGQPLNREQPPAHECRFWGIVGSGYPSTLIDDQLRSGTIANLEALSAHNPDGWGIAFYPEPQDAWPSLRPVIRRGGPAANNENDPDFDLGVDELAAAPRHAAIAHVRAGTSGHIGIPNPHPFCERIAGRDVCFAHNGGLRVDGLLELLDGFLDIHPPDYFEGAGTTGPIGAELYFLFLRSYVEAHPALGFTDALCEAIALLAADPAVTGDTPRMNFVLTDGDTLYALHYEGAGTENPVRFYPAVPQPFDNRRSGTTSALSRGNASSYWVVASEVMGSDPEWGTVPARTLAVLKPGEEPRFIPIPVVVGSGTERAIGSASAPRELEDRERAVDEAPAVGDPAAADPTAEDHNCRLWALIGSGYPAAMIEDQLMTGSVTNLRRLGSSNRDGWGFAFFPPPAPDIGLNAPIVLRGGPPAPSDEDYPYAVDEMREMAPVAAIGHVRTGTSGHWGIPDPHPLLHRGLVFAHNGSLMVTPLEERLGDDLLIHPPDYAEGYPGTGHVDSELYFLYLLKLVDEQNPGPLADALSRAAGTIVRDDEVIGSYPRLNFVLTDGDTLYALSYYGSGGSNDLCYYPVGSSSSFWVVASQPMGESSVGWGQIPPATLAVFVPGEAPRLLPVTGPGLYFEWVAVAGTRDVDHDGWYSRFTASCDPQMMIGSALVSADLWARRPDGHWIGVGAAEPRWIHATDPDSISIVCDVDDVDPQLRAQSWDLRLVLRTAEGDSASASYETHPDAGLRAFPVESAARDSISDIRHIYHFTRVDRHNDRDEDNDGFISGFDLDWDLTLEPAGDSALVSIRVCRAQGPRLIELGRTAEYWIKSDEPNTTALSIAITPEDQQAANWDLALELYDALADTVPIHAWWTAHTALEGVPVEGPAFDTRGWLGIVQPNPSSPRSEVRFVIPARVPDSGATLHFRILDAAGRLIWDQQPSPLEAGSQTIEWAGRDREGRRVASGAYFGEVEFAGRRWLRRFVVVR